MARVFCTNCGNAVYLDQAKSFAFCTHCGNRLDASSPAYSSNSEPPTSFATDRINECKSIKANKKYDGAFCNICGKVIQLGEPICLCNSCNSVNHRACWTNSKGCISSTCLGNNSLSEESKKNGLPPIDSRNTLNRSNQTRTLGDKESFAVDEKELVHCKWCKEPISKHARICIHCNRPQYEQPGERLNQLEHSFQEPLSALDWILVLCCSFGALFLGLIYHSTGNPKANKLLIASFSALLIQAFLLIIMLIALR